MFSKELELFAIYFKQKGNRQKRNLRLIFGGENASVSEKIFSFLFKSILLFSKGQKTLFAPKYLPIFMKMTQF